MGGREERETRCRSQKTLNGGGGVEEQVVKMVDYIGKGSPGPGVEKFRVWGRVYQPGRRVTGREVGAEG